MYIIEKFVKIFKKIIKKDKTIPVQDQDIPEQLEDIVTCKHTFMPIDSTGNILACSKCGYLVSKKRIGKKKF